MEFTFSLIILNLISCEAALRIIGGRDALHGEFSYAIRLETKHLSKHNSDDSDSIVYTQVCSGAAVSSSWILTAAHCHREEFVLIARYNSYFPNDMGKISPILKVYIHPQYDEQRFQMNQNDVALCLSQNLLVSQYGKLSAVDYKALVGHKVNILGFGMTNATASEKPLQVLDGMMNNCLEWDKADNKYYKATMMCVVPVCGVKAKACPGDSGGPVVHSSGIVGVNTMTSGRCDEFASDIHFFPGTSSVIVSMISHELDWIANVISNTDDTQLTLNTKLF